MRRILSTHSELPIGTRFVALNGEWIGEIKAEGIWSSDLDTFVVLEEPILIEVLHVAEQVFTPQGKACVRHELYPLYVNLNGYAILKDYYFCRRCGSIIITKEIINV